MQPTFVLGCLRWWAQVHFGLVIGSLQGATRLASRTFPAPSPRLRTKLLTDTMRHSRLNENAPERFRGLTALEARELIVGEMATLGLLEKIEDNLMMMPYGDRTGAVIEPWLKIDAGTSA